MPLEQISEGFLSESNSIAFYAQFNSVDLGIFFIFLKINIRSIEVIGSKLFFENIKKIPTTKHNTFCYFTD